MGLLFLSTSRTFKSSVPSKDAFLFDHRERNFAGEVRIDFTRARYRRRGTIRRIAGYVLNFIGDENCRS